MFWQYRLDMRELVGQINKMKEKGELEKKLAQVREEVAEKLENSSVFRQSNFPKRFREEVAKPEDLDTLMEEVFDFAIDQKVWLGV